MASLTQWTNLMEFEQTPGDGRGQGSLAFFSPWGLEELDMAEQPQLQSPSCPHLSRMEEDTSPEHPLEADHDFCSTPMNRGHQKAWASRWHGGKNPPANVGDAGDMGPVPGLGRSPGGGNGNPLQYSCLRNSLDLGACQATVHSVAKSQT